MLKATSYFCSRRLCIEAKSNQAISTSPERNDTILIENPFERLI